MSRKGFTLLEILLVIAAIGILASIIIVAINPGRQLAQARNAERQQEIGTIYDALQQYVIDTGSYPAGITSDYQEICRENPENDCTDLLDLSSVLVPTYLAAIPEDPTRANSGDPDDGTGYQVRVVGDVASLGVMTLEESEVIAVNDTEYTPPNTGPFSPNEFGTTYGAGSNSVGTLGTGTTETALTTFTANANTTQVWKDVEVDGSTTLAIAEDGSLWGWGSNYENLLMNQSTTSTPVQLDDGYWIDVSIAGTFALGIRSTGASQEMGEMYAWGERRFAAGDDCGWCNNFTTEFRLADAESDWNSDDWIAVSAGTAVSVGIRSSDGITSSQGTAWRWGQYSSSAPLIQSNDHTPNQIGVESNWTHAQVNLRNGYLMNTSGELYSWGDSAWGYLGRSGGDTFTPGLVSGGHTWLDISLPPTGDGTMYAIHTDGSLYAWGRDGYYSFGNNFYSNNPPGNWPNTVSTPTQISSDTDWKDVSGGRYGAIALKGDNYDVYGWGVNQNGWLGTGDTNDVPIIPSEPTITGPYSRVVTGNNNTAFLIE